MTSRRLRAAVGGDPRLLGMVRLPEPAALRVGRADGQLLRGPGRQGHWHRGARAGMPGYGLGLERACLPQGST